MLHRVWSALKDKLLSTDIRESLKTSVVDLLLVASLWAIGIISVILNVKGD